MLPMTLSNINLTNEWAVTYVTVKGGGRVRLNSQQDQCVPKDLLSMEGG